MSLPFFYIPGYQDGQTELVLEEDNSRHIVQVLRMKPGQLLHLTDGKGHLLTAAITEDHKKQCRVRVDTVEKYPRPEKEITIALSLLKNASRFEWFLEKAAEIGVSGVIPLLCERTEKQHFRQDRMQNILISALLQSRQTWLPDLSAPLAFSKAIDWEPFPANPGTVSDRGTLSEGGSASRKYIAHCLEEQRISLAGEACNPRIPQKGPALILIGPEGDFSKEEIDEALQKGFLPVTLGATRLRTETAGIVAATLLCIF